MMKTGLAIWHYPHRTVLENVNFFADRGFSSVSIIGSAMAKICMDETLSAQLASAIREKELVLTVHGMLPSSHLREDVEKFQFFIDNMAKWQARYGLLSVLSFDAPENIRDNVMPYINYVLQYEQFPKIAVEDFGLTEKERLQIDPLKNNERFGYLIDIGHMYIRLRGKNKKELTLFKNSSEECPQTDDPDYGDFMRAFKSKTFPVFEIHLHNNDGVDDQHYFLDDGALDIRMIARVLRDIEYDGVLTIESAPGYKFKCEYPESDERILKSFDLWKALCKTSDA